MVPSGNAAQDGKVLSEIVFQDMFRMMKLLSEMSFQDYIGCEGAPWNCISGGSSYSLECHSRTT